MRIERIGLSLDSIREERRREQREHPDAQHPFEREADAAPEPPEAVTADQPESPAGTRAAGRSPDDPTARLRLRAPEAHPKPTRRQAIEAFTDLDRRRDHELPDTDL